MADETSRWAKVVKTAATLAILMVGISGLAVMVVLGKPEPPTTEPEKIEAPPVTTALVTRQEKNLAINVDGVVVPFREIAVAAEVGGQVLRKSDVCDAGRYVRKGTLLIEIDARDYKIEVRRLEKELEQAEVNLRELDIEETNTKQLTALAKDSLELQRKEVARLEQLAKQGKNYVTESAIDVERRTELTARNALVTLENQLRTIASRREGSTAALGLVQANLDKVRLNLARTKITAPIDGMIIQDLVESDGYVAPGTVVARIEDVSQCNVRCNLRMDELFWIWNQASGATPTEQDLETAARGYSLPPTPTTVTYKLGDRRYEWDGVLARYDGIGVDETTRTVPCIVVVTQPNKVRELGADAAQVARGPRALVRGMYVELTIHARPQAPLLEVPEDAIKPGNRVWRVRDGKLNVIPIHVISVMDGHAVVRVKENSLSPGDQVVTSPMSAVYEDMPVRVKAEATP